MKRLILFTIVLSVSVGLFSQNCVVDNNITEPGIYPQNLDTAKIDEAYSFTMQILAIKDTLVDFMGSPITATIDSVQLWDVFGLPGDFDFVCEPTNCLYSNAAVGCVRLFGNPTKQDVGIHPLEIFTTAYASYSSFKLPVHDTIRDYQLVVRDTGSASIYKVTKDHILIYPNPVIDGSFTILTKMEVADLKIYDLQAREVDFTTVKKTNSLVVNMHTNNSGVYFVRFKSGDRIIEKRILK
jgi:hypothetical protein